MKLLKMKVITLLVYAAFA